MAFYARQQHIVPPSRIAVEHQEKRGISLGVKPEPLPAQTGPGQGAATDQVTQDAKASSFDFSSWFEGLLENTDIGLPDDEFMELNAHEDHAAKFLSEVRLTSLAPWKDYAPFPHERFAEGDMVGRFVGQLDEGKGRIVILVYAADEGGVMKGRYVFKMYDSDDQRITESASFASNMGQKLRIDPKNHGLVLNSHQDARYAVQMFRGASDSILIGNVYEKIKGSDALTFFASFKAEKQAGEY